MRDTVVKLTNTNDNLCLLGSVLSLLEADEMQALYGGRTQKEVEDEFKAIRKRRGLSAKYGYDICDLRQFLDDNLKAGRIKRYMLQKIKMRHFNSLTNGFRNRMGRGVIDLLEGRGVVPGVRMIILGTSLKSDQKETLMHKVARGVPQYSDKDKKSHEGKGRPAPALKIPTRGKGKPPPQVLSEKERQNNVTICYRQAGVNKMVHSADSHAIGLQFYSVEKAAALWEEDVKRLRGDRNSRPLPVAYDSGNYTAKLVDSEKWF